MHYLSADSYKLEVDPSALYSVLFVDKSVISGYKTEDIRHLNYTFLGNEPMVEREGVWTSVNMTIPKLTDSTESSNLRNVTVTIFVAFGAAPDAGLDGTLSLCVVPDTPDWAKTSIIRQLDDLPRIYISYLFNITGNVASA